MFILRVEEGDQRGEQFVLRDGANVIGRSHGVDIQINSADVSARQARIVVDGHKVVVHNESKFGTWVADRKLKGDEFARIDVGHVIRVGGSCQLRLLAEHRETAASASGSMSASTTASPGTRDTYSPTPKPTVGTTKATLAHETVPAGSTRTHASRETKFSATSATNLPIISEGADEPDAHTGAQSETADSVSESGDQKTRPQKTVFVPPDVIDRRVAEARKEPRRRVVRLFGLMAVIISSFLFYPKRPPEGKFEWDNTYEEAVFEVPRAGYKLIYPKNETTKVEPTADGVSIVTRLGRKREVPLFITLREDVNDKWASQDSSKSADDWMKSNPDRIFGTKSSWFSGKQNGVRIWRIPYTRNEKDLLAGEVHLFCHGRILEIVCLEIPIADQGRAENFLLYDSYWRFSDQFEQSHWEGQPRSSSISIPTLLTQVRDDLRREAPLTWPVIDNQLRMVLSQAVAEKRSADEEAGLRLLVNLRSQQARWFNSQQLQVINAQRSGDNDLVEAVAQRCQAVFSEVSDRRFFEVRKW